MEMLPCYTGDDDIDFLQLLQYLMMCFSCTVVTGRVICRGHVGPMRSLGGLYPTDDMDCYFGTDFPM